MKYLAGLAVAAAVLAGSAPAYAVPAGDIDMRLSDTTVGVGADTPLQPILYAKQEVTLTGAKITYALSGGLAGVSLVPGEEGAADCTAASATALTCTMAWEIGFGPAGELGYLSAGLKADKTATAGAEGTVTATFSADGVAPVVRTAKVAVAESVDLVGGPAQKLKIKPGTSFDAGVVVRNASSAVVHGASLIFDTDYGFQGVSDFANCRYRGDQPRACSFDQDLLPGVAYRAVLPYRLRADTYAPGNVAGEFQWMTPADYADYVKYLADNGYEGFGAAGKGAVLKLVPVPAAKALGKQTDVDPDNNWTSITIAVTGKQGTDVAAVGAQLSGPAGAVVTASVGLRNKGPATINRSRSGEPASVAIITIPAGTKVVTVSAGCNLATDGSEQTKPGAVQYFCRTGYVFYSGKSELFTFTLKIEKVIPDATGAVEANPPCECDRFSADLDKSNDRAAIVVNASAGQNGGGTETGGGTATGDGGEDGGTLPITGPQGAALGGLGTVLVLAGVGGYLIARRRRTRFEA